MHDQWTDCLPSVLCHTGLNSVHDLAVTLVRAQLSERSFETCDDVHLLAKQGMHNWHESACAELAKSCWLMFADAVTRRRCRSWCAEATAELQVGCHLAHQSYPPPLRLAQSPALTPCQSLPQLLQLCMARAGFDMIKYVSVVWECHQEEHANLK